MGTAAEDVAVILHHNASQGDTACSGSSLRLFDPPRRQPNKATDHNSKLPSTSARDDTLQAFKASVQALLQEQYACRRKIEQQWSALQRQAQQVEFYLAGFLEEAPASQRAGAFTTGASAVVSACGPLDLATPEAQTKLSPNSTSTPQTMSTSFLAVNDYDQTLRCRTPHDQLHHQSSFQNLDKPEDAAMASKRSTTEDLFFNRVQSKDFGKVKNPQALHMQTWRAYFKSPQFDMLVGVVIVLNMVSIILRVQYDGVLAKPTGAPGPSQLFEDVLLWVEHMFTVFFLIELLLRLAANGPIYLKSPVNILDAGIVAISCLDSWVFSIVNNNSGGWNISVLRIFRLMRLMKVFRVVRVMKAFKPLRVLVSAVTDSIGALLWSMTLLFVLELIGAILLAQTLYPAITDEDRDPASRERLWRTFGTMVRAWLTLFELTMAPGGFLQHRPLYDEVHPILSFGIAIYVCFVSFAVTRVITALFLKETLSASEKDNREAKETTKSFRKAYAAYLCAALEPDEQVGRSRIDKARMQKMLDLPQLQDWLKDMELEREDAERLFTVLDVGDGSVVLTDYMRSLCQMSRHNRGYEVILHTQSDKVLNTLCDLQNQMEDLRHLLQHNRFENGDTYGDDQSKSQMQQTPPALRQNSRQQSVPQLDDLIPCIAQQGSNGDRWYSPKILSCRSGMLGPCC